MTLLASRAHAPSLGTAVGSVTLRQIDIQQILTKLRFFLGSPDAHPVTNGLLLVAPKLSR